jgi:hypothetical protein
MLMEDMFITTLDGPACLAMARAFWQEFGFVMEDESAHHVQLRRGKAQPHHARTVGELPLTIRLEYDRGRVTLAALLAKHGKVRLRPEVLLQRISQCMRWLLIDGQVEQARQHWLAPGPEATAPAEVARQP